MGTKAKSSTLTQAELNHLDSLITLLQEQGVRLDDVVKGQSDVCCCGAVAAEAKGKFVLNEHDREIVSQMIELERKLESSPTLAQLIEIRGELLRERRR